MILKLLPVEVELDLISAATSPIITPQVIISFTRAGGDYANAVPFCLLASRRAFLHDSKKFPTDYDENIGRALACEVLARRIVHALPMETLQTVMSTRYRYREDDGDRSAPTSALEAAIDGHAIQFLSSTEAQHVVTSLWNGEWIQQNNEADDIDYIRYDASKIHTFWGHVNPQRLGVPRYQNIFRQIVWITFLVVYSQAVASPLWRSDPLNSLDQWEYVLYLFAFSQMLEECVKLVKSIRLSSSLFSAVDFWTVVTVTTDVLLLSALGLRIEGICNKDTDLSMQLRMKSFQVLACVAPLLWIRLITVFELYRVVGTMQIIVSRMLRESAIFFILLGIMALGFIQSLLALDAADSKIDSFWAIINLLIQALLGSPGFDQYEEGFSPPFGMVIYYFWSFLTLLILLNILIALFGTAYSDISENAMNEYLCAYSYKTISMIRAPDSFVYPSPFNIVEFFFIAPIEWFVSKKTYEKINLWIMRFLFFIPLTVIAVYESQIAPSKRFAAMFPENDVDGDITSAMEDPEDEEDGTKISAWSFEELTENFPNTTLGDQATIVNHIVQLESRMKKMEKLLESQSK
ncbi:hypothetical protein [Phaffia rhodozyma]|uniref:Uncharacterized protein n=1 Tax=Phaffia rhodozyma TaxID=264483 RepID=A0A0F7SMS5_PHARH|nr:hypothetical protein [Phaffia rhodozyma]